MAAKRTARRDPALPSAARSPTWTWTSTARGDGFDIEARVRTEARTGAEMEALHAVAVAALTVYDMVKAVDKGMTITDIRLVAEIRRRDWQLSPSLTGRSTLRRRRRRGRHGRPARLRPPRPAGSHRAPRRARHHRHAARRPSSASTAAPRARLRTWTASPREGAVRRRRHRPRAPDAALPRHDVHRPPALAARHPRQHLAGGGAAGAAAGRGLQGGTASPPPPSSPRSCSRRRPASAAASTSTATGIARRPRERASSTRSSGAAIAPCARPRAGSRPTIAQGRLFVWLHLYDPHDPYEPPEPYASRFARPALRRRGRLRRRAGGPSSTPRWPAWACATQTLLVVTSDHGEGLGEHGETLHGFFVYQTTLAVPLVAARPGHRARDAARRARSAWSTSIPTVPDLAGLSLPAGARPPGAASPPRCAAAPRRRRRPRLRGVPGAAAALRLERPARAARRALEIHPGPAAGAVRPRRRPRRAQQPRRARSPRARPPSSPRSAACSTRSGRAAARRAGRRAARGAAGEAGRPRLRRRRRSRADEHAGRRPQGQDRGVPRRQRPDARGPPARWTSGDFAASAARFEAAAAPGHRELRGPLLPGPRARRPGPATRRPRRHFEEAVRRRAGPGGRLDEPGPGAPGPGTEGRRRGRPTRRRCPWRRATPRLRVRAGRAARGTWAIWTRPSRGCARPWRSIPRMPTPGTPSA